LKDLPVMRLVIHGNDRVFRVNRNRSHPSDRSANRATERPLLHDNVSFIGTPPGSTEIQSDASVRRACLRSTPAANLHLDARIRCAEGNRARRSRTPQLCRPAALIGTSQVPAQTGAPRTPGARPAP